jgi:hypothetical protein
MGVLDFLRGFLNFINLIITLKYYKLAFYWAPTPLQEYKSNVQQATKKAIKK